MAKYNCLLFDVDGTLLDFKAAEQAALIDTFAQFSFPDTPEAYAAYHEINNGMWAALERGEIKQDKLVVQRFIRLLDTFGMHGDASNINAYYLNQLAQHADMFPGADEMLQELAEVATLAVVSNGIEAVQVGRLEKSGLAQYFDGVFISGRVGAAKPLRKLFDVALKDLGIENRDKVLVVGDSLAADVVGGNNAGLCTCWFNRTEQPLPENAPKPAFTIYGYEELPRIVMEEEELENVGNPEKRHYIPVIK